MSNFESIVAEDGAEVTSGGDLTIYAASQEMLAAAAATGKEGANVRSLVAKGAKGKIDLKRDTVVGQQQQPKAEAEAEAAAADRQPAAEGDGGILGKMFNRKPKTVAKKAPEKSAGDEQQCYVFIIADAKGGDKGEIKRLKVSKHALEQCAPALVTKHFPSGGNECRLNWPTGLVANGGRVLQALLYFIDQGEGKRLAPTTPVPVAKSLFLLPPPYNLVGLKEVVVEFLITRLCTETAADLLGFATTHRETGAKKLHEHAEQYFKLAYIPYDE